MDGSGYASAASVVVAVIMAGSAELSRRAAAKAAKQTRSEESRVEIEKAAYQRAEEMLDRQFKRQEEEIEGLHADVARLEHKVRVLETGREDDRRELAQRDAQIQTYAALLAARGIDPP